MSVALDRPKPRPSYVPTTVLLGALVMLSAAVVTGRGVHIAAALCLATSFFALFGRALSRWHVMLAAIVLVILFVPIKRYKIAANLPFDLELYRVMVALVLMLWIGALLADPRVRVRRTFLDRPLLLLGIAYLGSVVTNLDRIRGADSDSRRLRALYGVLPVDLSVGVAKALLFVLSFYLVYYFIASTIREPRVVETILKVLVGGCALVAIFAIVERRTGYNLFDQLGGIVPFSVFQGDPTAIGRGGSRLRVYGSAQSPIALAALFVMIFPFAIYLAKVTKRKVWAAAAVVLVFGVGASVSRTGVTMIVAVLIVLIVLRKVDPRRIALFALPVLLALHIAVPGAIGGLRQAFFPSQGLIAEQTQYGGRVSGKRLNPQFRQIAEKPFFGVGYGTRVTSGPGQNALVLDNEWLGTTVDIGLIGFGAWVWFFVRLIRRVGGEARRDTTPRGWLLTAQTSAVAAFAVGMLTYDAFSFIQVTFVLFVIAALADVTLRHGRPSTAPVPFRPV